MKILFFTILWLGLNNLTWAKSAQDTVRILWIGSSSTYCHDLPLQTAQWLESFFYPQPIRSYLVGKSGTGFHEYLEPGFEAQYGLKPGQTLLEKIIREQYDFVVLQMITYFIGADLKEETELSTDILIKAILDSGAEPVIYEMGWRTGPENEIGRQLIADAAEKHQVKYYAACSSAWKKVRAENQSIELHNLPDSDHPGTLGTYLNLSCLYTAFTGKKHQPRVDQIEVWPRFGNFDKKKAAEIVANSNLNYYHSVLPGWMQLISAMRTKQIIKPEEASYLDQVAFESWKNLKKTTIK